MMFKKFVQIAVMLAVSTSVHGKDAVDEVFIDLGAIREKRDTYQPIKLQAGKKVTVTAVENRSTGYAWEVQNKCGKNMKLVNDEYGYDEP